MTDIEPAGPPARGYSWPPFAPGHELSLRHGAHSARKVNPIADAMLDALMAETQRPGSQVGYLAEASYSPMIRRWAVLEAKCELLRSYLDGFTDWETGQPGDIDDAGKVRPAADLLVKVEAQASKLAERLGLDPLSRSKLGRDVAAAQADIEKVQAAGAASLAARATAVTIPPTPEEHDHEDPDDPA